MIISLIKTWDENQRVIGVTKLIFHLYNRQGFLAGFILNCFISF